jgi:ABC-2 type transport system permease protein
MTATMPAEPIDQDSARHPATGDLPLRRPGGLGAAGVMYGAIFATSFRDQLAYAGQLALRGLFLAMILFVFLQLWRATYEAQGTGAGGTLGGFTIAQMLWYLALAESIILSRPRITLEIDREVRTGEIAYVLLRPYGYAGYRLARYLAERLLRFGICLALGTALALLYVGPVPLSPPSLAAALVALALALLLDFLAMLGIGLLAFWVEDTTSITLLYDRLVMLLGGMMLPLDVFPEPIATVARALPFSQLVYGPARLALSSTPQELAPLLLRQVVALAVTGLLVHRLHAAAFHRIHSNGG